MTESQSPAQAARHTATNLGWYVVVCLVLAVIYVAWDTHLFTKQPSWWLVRQSVGYDDTSSTPT